MQKRVTTTWFGYGKWSHEWVIIYGGGGKNIAKSGDRVIHVLKESFNSDAGPTFP